jgi:hypothetical protein
MYSLTGFGCDQAVKRCVTGTLNGFLPTPANPSNKTKYMQNFNLKNIL